MANYDAEIRVNTKIDTSQMQKLQIQIDKATAKAAELSKKQEELRNKKVPTEQYTRLETEISAAKAELDSLIKEEERLVSAGLALGAPWDNVIAKEAEAQLKIEQIQEQMQKLSDTGKDLKPAGDVEEIKKVTRELSLAQAELRALKTKEEELIKKQKKGAYTTSEWREGFEKLGNSAGRALDTMSRKTKKTNGLMSVMGTRLKGLALSLLIFNQISKGFNAMTAAAKEGYQNLVKYSATYNRSASLLMSANTQLKNSFATAFTPIMEMAMPYLLKLVQMLIEASNRVAQFTAALTGSKTWTKAVAVQQDYAGALNGTADAAKKAYRALAGFDQLNVLEKNSTGSASGGLKPEDMFTDVEISSDTLAAVDLLKDKFDNLKKAMEPFSAAVERLWNEGLSKLKDFSAQGLKDFYNEFLVPMGTWAFGTEDKGLTRLVNIINDDLSRIPWETVNKNLKEFWKAIQPYAESFGEGLIDFFEDASDVAVDTFIMLFGEDGALVWLTDWLNDNDPEQAKGWGYALGVLATGLLAFKAIRPFASIFKTLLPAAGKLAGKVSAAKGVSLFGNGSILPAGMIGTGAAVSIIEGQKILEKNDKLLEATMSIPVPKEEDFKTLEEYSKAMEEYDKQVKDLFTDHYNQFDLELDEYNTNSALPEWWRNNFNPSIEWMSKIKEETKDLFKNLKEDCSNGWNDINDWWHENAPLSFVREWFVEDVQPWFAEEKWRGQLENVKKSFVSGWQSVAEWWDNSAISKWWDKSVVPWFTKERWKGGMCGIIEAFWETFNAAAKTAADIFENLINWINENLNMSFGNTLSTEGKKGGSRQAFITDMPTMTSENFFSGWNPYVATASDLSWGQLNRQYSIPTIEQAFQNVHAKNGETGEINLTVNLDGEPVYKSVVKRDKIHQKSTGHSAFSY